MNTNMPNHQQPDQRQLNIRIDTELANALETQARNEERTIAGLVRHALRNYLRASTKPRTEPEHPHETRTTTA